MRIDHELQRRQHIIRSSWLQFAVRVMLVLVGLQLAWQSSSESTRAAADASPLPHLLRVFRGHTGAINSVAVSTDGKYFLTGSDDQTARLWSVSTGNVVHDLHGHRGGVQSVAFSMDGMYVLTGSKDSTAKLWDVASGREVRQFAGHTDWVNTVTFSPEGKWLATGSRDQSVRIWDMQTGQTVQTLVQPASVLALKFDPANYLILAAGGDGIVRQGGVDGRGEESALDNVFDEPSSIASAVSFDWECWLSCGCFVREITLTNQAAAVELWNSGWVQTTLSSQHGAVRSVAVAPDQKFMLTGNDDHTASLWKIDAIYDNTFGAPPKSLSSTLVGSFGSQSASASAVTSVAFSPDDLFILTGYADGTAALWSFYDVLSHFPNLHIPGSNSVSSISFVDVLNGWAMVPETWTTSAIHVTHDGGQTWLPWAMAPPGTNQLRFTSRSDGWALYASASPYPITSLAEPIWSTHDGGLTWRRVHVPATGVVRDVIPMGKSLWVLEEQCPDIGDCPGLIMGQHSLLFKSEDGGQTWQTVGAGRPIWLFYLTSPQDALFFSNGDQDQTELFTTHDGGRTWQTIPSPCYEFDYLAAINPHQIWVLCELARGTQDDEPKQVYATINGGLHWTLVSDSDQSDQIPNFGTPAGLVFTSAKQGYAIFQRRGVWSTSDGGHTWVRSSFDNGIDWQDYAGNLTDLIFVDSQHGWFRGENWGVIYRTIDGGLHWDEFIVP